MSSVDHDVIKQMSTDYAIEQLAQAHTTARQPSPVSGETLSEIESELGVVLPNDLRGISSFLGGDYVGGIEHTDIALHPPNCNIVDSTLALRKSHGVPTNYVVLTEMPLSTIVLETASTADVDTRVVWLDDSDIPLLSAETPDDRFHKVFHSCKELFVDLLKEEGAEL